VVLSCNKIYSPKPYANSRFNANKSLLVHGFEYSDLVEIENLVVWLLCHDSLTLSHKRAITTPWSFVPDVAKRTMTRLAFVKSVGKSSSRHANP